MPVVKNDEAREIPWRPGYRNFVLAGEAEGVSVSSSLAVLEQGAGAPLHFHEEVDEVIVILEGTLDLRIGDERFMVGEDQTISIPPARRMPSPWSAPRARASSPFCRGRARTWRRSISRAGRRRARR